MKLNKIFSTVVITAVAGLSYSCDSEKELIIIEGNLPIKTNSLYMVGDAAPSGWSIDSPTPFEASEEDPLVFRWQGSLNSGELKLCLVTGSWDSPFIRPLIDQEEINSTNISNAEFQMHAGDPDEKWRVTESGTYFLEFDLRNWTMSTTYLGAASAPVIEPIESATLYIVGDATPNGWNIDDPTQLDKKSDYIFEYEGVLNVGELKACLTPGSWDVDFVRPSSDGVEISDTGVADNNFIFVANPDNKWKVTKAGIYNLSFNLYDWTITATFLSEYESEIYPIETSTLFMIGDATPNGWSMDEATEFSQDENNPYIFSWQGELVPGTFKACIEKDPTYSCPFIRPAYSDCPITTEGVESPEFVYTTSPDDQWRIQSAGTYKVIFDLENWTIEVNYLD